MARPSGPKTRCSGQWTEARFNSFIKNNLRLAAIKWAPIQECLKEARVRRGFYKCNGCKEEVTASIKIDGKRRKNAIVDHIKPIIDPVIGFTTWDDCINRMFCEKDNLQVLCHACHTDKSNAERALAKERNNAKSK
jgi:5-methylcytosine-specific restriction endonuclease McrA